MIKFTEAVANKTGDFDTLTHQLGSKFPLINIPAEVAKFVSYWTELTPSGKKQRWETEKTFEIERRLANWLSRVKPEQNHGRGVFIS